MATERQRSQQRKKITVILDPVEAERFERYCEEGSFKKSTIVARPVREHLNSQGFRRSGEPPS